jgi:D-glycero-D-manno-heptose 1,7-bisphosphate phosphatase
MTSKNIAPKNYVVLDRDGTLIVEHNYLSDYRKVELLPGVATGLRQLTDLGFGLAVITNQSGIGRGYFDWDCVAQIHRRLEQLLEAEGIKLAGIYVCPHIPDEDCPCRKPQPQLLRQAAEELNFDPKDCFVIGDKPCDIELGQQMGATTLLVRTGYGGEVEGEEPATPDYVVDDISEGAKVIQEITANSRRVPTQELGPET